MKIEIEIRPHLTYPKTHSTAKVIVRGRVWATDWAGTPTEEQVREAWRTDRRSFMPYNESEGIYVR